MTGAPPDLETVLPRPDRYDLLRTLAPLRHGLGDPTIRLEPGRVRRAARTPEGPATLEILDSGTALLARAWGTGAAWAVTQAPGLLGLGDDPAAFDALPPPDRLVGELSRRFSGLRQPRTGRVVEALVPAVLEQKVTGEEARRAYRALIRAHGERAPGPFGLRLQPPPDRLARLPYYAYHPLGLERRRAEVLRRIGATAARLEEAAFLPPDEARRRLGAIVGVGPWTVNEVARDALGDPDAVSVGDFHLPDLVCFALAGEARADDRRMLELLEPYRGRRARVVRLLEASGIQAPRYGPRMVPRSIATL